MSNEDIELLGAAEVASILGVNKNMVYRLWDKKLLGWWLLNGTKKTTRTEIAEFLARTKCTDLRTLESA